MPLGDKEIGADQEITVDKVPVIRVRVQQRVGDGARVVDLETWMPGDASVDEQNTLLDRVALLCDRQVRLNDLAGLEENLKAGEAKGSEVGVLQAAELDKVGIELQKNQENLQKLTAMEMADHEASERRGDYRPSITAKKLAAEVRANTDRIAEIQRDVTTLKSQHEKNLAAARVRVAALREEIAALGKSG